MCVCVSACACVSVRGCICTYVRACVRVYAFVCVRSVFQKLPVYVWTFSRPTESCVMSITHTQVVELKTDIFKFATKKSLAESLERLKETHNTSFGCNENIAKLLFVLYYVISISFQFSNVFYFSFSL